jgi:hypothetical protein
MSLIRIKVITGPEAGTVVEGAGRVTIGSASYCTLRLSGKGVLAVHAEVNLTPQGLHLRSFSSTGTRVNGAAVTEHYVSEDEEAEIGDGTRISVELARAAATPPRRSSREAAPEGTPRRAPRPAPVEAARAEDVPASGFMATLWRYRIIAGVYIIVLVAVAWFFVGSETGLPERYEAAATAFTQETTQAKVPTQEAKARWAAVEKAYSLERAGRRREAIEAYVRLMAQEMELARSAGGGNSRSAAWKFGAQRLAALRSRR